MDRDAHGEQGALRELILAWTRTKPMTYHNSDTELTEANLLSRFLVAHGVRVMREDAA